MLQLGKRTFQIEDVIVHGDHADPELFWYLAAPVVLARRGNPAKAQLTMIKYKPAVADAGVKGGGFLMFETELTLTEDVERRIKARCRQLGASDPVLVAVPYDSGTVQCVALNLQGPGGTTATPPAGSDGTGYTFVQQILGSSAPSLQGKNAAVFSLQLDQEGATILEQVFRQRGAPVSVIYNLEYTALSESPRRRDQGRPQEGLRLAQGGARRRRRPSRSAASPSMSRPGSTWPSRSSSRAARSRSR